MRKFLMPIIVALVIIASTISAHAQPPTQSADENLVKIRLLAERGNVSGGDEIWVGIEQSITPHWHTYWQNPGDSGTITKADWKLPNRASIGAIQWPTPKRLPYGPLMNFGYEDNVVLLQKLKLPAQLPNGAITLSADIELLVCKEECIPEYGTYTLTLNGEQSEAEDNTAFFETAISKLPIQVDWNADFIQNDKNFKLNITLPKDIASDIRPETLAFYPLDWGLIENAKTQSALLNETTLSFTQNKGERSYTELETAKFILTYKNQNDRSNSFEITATQAPTKKALAITATPENTETGSNITILSALIYALLGGMVLNLMPCVFPVLSIKALSLVKIADEHPTLAKMHGLAYTAGVILSFIAIAAILLILKSAGAQIGWGFQLQNPIVVGALAYLLFIIGLNLMGYFEFGNRLGNVGNKLTQGSGLNGSFFTGVLATLVATPCTAPFMAAAIGFALTQAAIVNLAVFTALGLGLALPYLALSFAPALQRIMPKPGAWMNTFKELLAFPIFLSAVWLTWVIAKQAGSTGVLQLLIGMSAIGFGIWLLRKSARKMALKIIAILFFAASLFMLIMPTAQTQDTNAQAQQAKEFGETFTPQKLETLLAEETAPIFVEMTAAWCITCKVNHATSININSTKKAFADNNVRYLIGDWTNQDPQITKYLNRYGRNGVPIYVFYGAKDENGQRPEAKILPQILSPTSITKMFK